ncbi:uncharacterized protein LOC111874493 [Cryptotermes secundus]|nr:uncharacterized protein LOC111874493 [Cryptotermes secundus]
MSSEHTKFCYVISQLDQRYTSEAEDIITSPPKRDPYTTLRTELVRRLSPSKEQRIRELLTLEDMGDRKPSQFLRHLRNLAPDIPDDLLRSMWSNRLPAHIRAILAGQTENDLDATARCADRITEAAPQQTLASVALLPEKNDTWKYVKDRGRQVQTLNAKLGRIISNSRNRRSASRSPSREKVIPTLCLYHHRYGARAQKCTQPSPTASRKTNTADINGGTCLHPKQRPPFRHG